MATLTPTLLTIILNVNDLNTSLEDRDLKSKLKK